MSSIMVAYSRVPCYVELCYNIHIPRQLYSNYQGPLLEIRVALGTHNLRICIHRPLSCSFLGLPYRILNINHNKELLRGLWEAGGRRTWLTQ